MTSDDQTPPPPSATVDAVAQWFAALHADLEGMNRDIEVILSAASDPTADVARLAKAGRDGIKDRVRVLLGERPRVNGAGLIFSRSARGEGKGVTEWWVRDGDSDVTRYQFGVNPGGQRFYDYETLEWFTVSFTSGRPWVTGPYIDYLGVEEYIVTATVRAEVHGRAVGVTGLDMTIAELERELLPLLRLARRPSALLNPHGGVLVSSTSSLATGDLMTELPAGFRRLPIPAMGATLSLIVADDPAARR